MVIVVKMPSLSPTMKDGKIVKFRKQIGDTISSGEILFEVETDKAIMEYESIENGYVLWAVDAGLVYQVNDIVAIIGNNPNEDISSYLNTKNDNNHNSIKTNIKIDNNIASNDKTNIKDKVKISPLARKISLENKIEYKNIKGSGPGGRIVKSDIIKLIPTSSVLSTNNIVNSEEEFEIVTQTSIQEISARRLSESRRDIPHFEISDVVDVSRMIDLRTSIKSRYSVSINDLILKAVGKAAENKIVNSHYKDGKIYKFKKVNVSFAVHTDKGILVPIINDINNKTILSVSDETKKLIDECRGGNTKNYGNGSITVSNMGSLNVERFSAIINPPQVCIIAIGSIRNNKMCITLSFDHRVIDGYDGAKFINDLKYFIENPNMIIV